MLIRYEGGARGVLVASQISAGEENALTLKVYGTEGGLEWRQEEPNDLVYKPAEAPVQIYRRGNEYLCEEAKKAVRLPPGHPEAFIEAFANVYGTVANSVRSGERSGFPTVYDGARGVHFIEKVVESSKSERKWTDVS
jgi:predicted dehydrogenase